MLTKHNWHLTDEQRMEDVGHRLLVRIRVH